MVLSYLDNIDYAKDIISKADIIEREFNSIFDERFNMVNIDSMSKTIRIHPYMEFALIDTVTGKKLVLPYEDGAIQTTDVVRFIFSSCIDERSVKALIELFESDTKEVALFSDYIADALLDIADVDVMEVGEDIRNYILTTNSYGVDITHQRSTIEDACVYYTLEIKHQIIHNKEEVREFLLSVYEDLLLDLHAYYIQSFYMNEDFAKSTVQNYILNKGEKCECEVFSTPAGWTYIYKNGLHLNDENDRKE